MFIFPWQKDNVCTPYAPWQNSSTASSHPLSLPFLQAEPQRREFSQFINGQAALPKLLAAGLSGGLGDVPLQVPDPRDAPCAQATQPVPLSLSLALRMFRLLWDSSTLQPWAPVPSGCSWQSGKHIIAPRFKNTVNHSFQPVLFPICQSSLPVFLWQVLSVELCL